MERLREVLAIVNDKGGVGKSTTAHNLACGLIKLNPETRVLIIDLDAQVANVSLLCGWREREDKHGTMYEAMVNKTAMPVYQVRIDEQDYHGNLYIAPSSEEMLSVEPFLLREINPLKVLQKLFAIPVTLTEEQGGEQSVIEAFDYIIIDCPPAMNLVTKNAMSVATGIIIPMQLEALPTFGSSSVIRWAEEVKAEINPNLELRGLLKVMVDKRTKASAGFSQHIDDEYGEYVFKTEIPRRTKIVEAQAMMQDIFTYAPECDAAKSYEDFAQEIVDTYTED
ncbi:MAG: ParA family protein [Prevotella sp.]|nr:ParA family protein [Prevotella sp.]